MECRSCQRENADNSAFCSRCGEPLLIVCSSCSRPNALDASFCSGCGTRLIEASPPVRTPTPPPSPALPASFAAGRYQVRRFLGEGGRKRVYLAHDDKLDRDVAFALIKTEGLDADGVVRVRREAQAMGRLGDHAHIVTIHDVGDEGGQQYIVSQYMAGGSVEDLLTKAPGHKLATAEACRLAEEVCQALEHAHSRGIVHRDLKPGNVWLTADGTAQLGDFGLAVALDRSRMTMAGMMVGTVAYMAPEQALGRQPDARSDLYSLGSMLYEAVTGQPPFLGDDAIGVISQHINTAAVAPSWHNPEIPKPLDSLILRLLAKSPQDRPASAEEVAAEIRRILDRTTAEPVAQQPQVVTDLRALDWGRFVGRREEMEQLKSALETSLSGKLSLAFIAGEPGIGKTRLAEEFAVYGGLRGAQVLTGRCYEGEASIPYRPFVEAIRHYARSRPDREIREQLGPGAPEVATLVSEVRQQFPDIPESPKLEAEAERLRLFDSVTQFLRNASRSQPLVLFLDDLHWADKPSLLMLQHIARHAAGDRLLVLASYRDVELDRTHPLSDSLTELRRQPNFQRVLLRGLPAEEVEEFLASMDPSEEGRLGRHALALLLERETEGNPFFIREVVSHLVETGKIVRESGRWVGRVQTVEELGIPEGVREVIGRRLSRLSEGCNRMLTRTATMAHGFAWEALKAIGGEPEGALLEHLEEALAAQLIGERRESPGTYDFTHALIRQTLYGELSTPRRVLLHREIGEALEKLYAGNLEPHLTELAHHFYQAAPGGDVEKALDYAGRAGERAMALYAYEEAAEDYRKALQVLELSTPRDEAKRCELLLQLGEAKWSAGEIESSRATFRSAADLARKLGSPEQLAWAALGVGQSFEAGVVDELLVGLLEESLAALGETDSALRAKALARLAAALIFTAERERRESLSREAVDVARRIDDKGTLAYVLAGGHVALWEPDNLEERLAIAGEIVGLAEEAGDKGLALAGHSFRFSDLMELGDVAAAYQQIEAHAALAKELRQAVPLWFVEQVTAQRALLEGRFEEGASLAQSALAMGQELVGANAMQVFAIQMSRVRSEQGRLQELEAMIKGFADRYPAIPGWRARLASVYSELGRQEDARREFERLAVNDFAAIPRDGAWLVAIVYLAEACAFLKDAGRAPVLYEMLLPYADRNIMVGAAASNGSAARYLAPLAATMGRWEEAERHFEAAVEMNARMGARPLVARTQIMYAEMLLRRNAPGDRVRALALLAEALETTQALGMSALVERAVKLKVEAQGISSSGVYTSIDAVAASVQRERPAISVHAAPDGTVTIMFSDIEGSTAMTERLGDQRWIEVLREHNAIVREQIAAHGGFEVKSEGDGFMVAFQSARKGLECAVGIQRALEARNSGAERSPSTSSGRTDAEAGAATDSGRTDGEAVRVRIGLHAGEVTKEGAQTGKEDYFGRNVIMAARVASQAHGGEILVSGVLKALVAGSDIPWGEARSAELKGLSGEHEIWPVAWSES